MPAPCPSPGRLRVLPRVLSGLLLAGVACLSARAQFGHPADNRPQPPDPDRIINGSMNFLQDREPDLTAEESALYEHARGQKPELAIRLVEGLVAASKNEKPASPAFLVLLGNLHYASGAFDRAEASYRQAVDRYPPFLRAWTNLGVLHYARQQYAKAIPCLAQAVTLGSRDSTTFGMMGECLENTGDAVGAEVAYVQALAGDPGNPRWMEGLLRVYLEARQYPRAEVMVRKLIREQPAEARHWLTYARLMNADGRKLEAIALLEQALATGMAGDEELLELAGLYADQQLIPEALRTYDRVKITAAALGEARLLQLVRMLIARAEWDRAQALLDEIKPKPAGAVRPEFLLARAELFSARQQWAAARGVLDELLKADPMNGRALLGLGRAYAAEGDVSRAMLTFETALQTRDGVRPASIELAHLELEQRHFAKSISHLETALTLGRSEDIEEILERVRALEQNAPDRAR